MFTKKSELPSTWKNIGESHPSFRFSIGARVEIDLAEEEAVGHPKWIPGTVRGFDAYASEYDILLDYPVGKYGRDVATEDTNNFTRPLGFTKSATYLTDPCGNCGVNAPTDGVVKFLQCGSCRRKRYCTPTCQKADWKTHRVLCKAIIKQNERVLMEIKELIKTGKAEAVQTALYDAVMDDDLVIIRKLLKKRRDDIDVNAVDDDGDSLLYFASHKGSIGTVKVLIEAGSNVNQATTDDGSTPLYTASQEGNVDIVKVLIKAGGNVNQASTDDGTPLLIASLQGNVDIVKVLIKAGGNVNKISTKDGVSPLWIAAQQGNVDTVRVLIKAGGNINQTSLKNIHHSLTPLSIACCEGHTETVRLLLQQPNIDVNKGATEEWSLLALVKDGTNHNEIVQLLIDAGAQ